MRFADRRCSTAPTWSDAVRPRCRRAVRASRPPNHGRLYPPGNASVVRPCGSGAEHRGQRSRSEKKPSNSHVRLPVGDRCCPERPRYGSMRYRKRRFFFRERSAVETYFPSRARPEAPGERLSAKADTAVVTDTHAKPDVRDL